MLPTTHQHLSTPPRQRAACWLQVALALLLALGALAALPPASTRAATLTVTNGNDDGPGSLRDTLYGAAAGDTITFAPGVSTVTLTTSELVVSKDVTIQGRGMGGVTVQRGAASGTPNFRVFNVLGSVAALSGLTIRNGVDHEPYAAGGGIFNDGNLTLINSIVSDNSVADFGLGGGIVNTSDLTLINSTVSANSARYGGGIYMDTGNLTLMGTTISGNNGGVSGGGIYLFRGSATLTNSTISGNRAINGGGFAKTGGGTASLTAVTVSGNRADGGSGGGLYAHESAVVRLRASIVAGNSAPAGADCGSYFTGNYPPTSLGNNVVGSGTGCPANGPGDLAYGGALAALLNPTLAANGGPTQTHALPLGSPAIGHVPALRCSDIATDQRGVHRPQGGNCDSGAFELSHFTLTFSAVGPGTVRATTSGLPLGSTLPPTSSHPQGKVVALSATPAAGARFVGWTVNGKPAGTANPLSLTMSENLSVVATFAPLR